MELTKLNLTNCFEAAKKENAKYIGVAVSVNGAAPEVIINSNVNFEDKHQYYLKAYSADLSLIANPNIKIVGFTQADSFEELEKHLCI